MGWKKSKVESLTALMKYLVYTDFKGNNDECVGKRKL